MNCTPRERVRAALRGERADRVPFTVYWSMIPRGEVERALRNQGTTIVERVPLYRVQTPNVQTVNREFIENGECRLRKELRSPVGTVHSTYRLEKAYGTSLWQLDHFIKSPADYDILEYIIQDREYVPDFDAFRLASSRYGEDGYVVGNTEYSPMNMLIYELAGIERFSLDLLDRPERILRLYELLRDKQKRLFELCADSPAELVLYCGNISQEVVGLERFQRFYLPCLNEFSELLHQAGKLAGCHLDASMADLVEAVADSKLDVVEAFTPAPTCDVTVKQARKAWPDKILWINFPSSVHVRPARSIQTETLEILRQAVPGDRFLVGITEDVPEEYWRTSLPAINDCLRIYGRLPIEEKRLSGAL